VAKALNGSGPGFGGFDLAVMWFSGGDKRVQEPASYRGGFVNGTVECSFVCLGRFVKAGQFTHEL
jgi:hypothetical protein